jgi:flagellar motor switch protein FliM
MQPLRGLALLVFTSDMVAALVEISSVVGARSARSATGDFSRRRARIIQMFREIAIREITAAWSSVLPLKVEMSASGNAIRCSRPS